ncbi:MAG: 30S ribosomal protein S1, partial [Desulfuromonas sp.]
MLGNKENGNMMNDSDLADDDKDFGEMEQSFEALFEESMQELNVGDVVKGTIVQVNPDSVVVDVGYKSEGVIPLSEFADEKGDVEINVGDEYDVLFERTENESGLISLSKEKADRQKVWNALEEGAVVEGRIVSRIKGGLSVDIGVSAFL